MAKTPAKTRARPAEPDAPCETEVGVTSETEPAQALPVNKLRSGARELAPLALKTLAAVMNGNHQASVKLGAAREVLDRGYGPTNQPGRPAPKKVERATAPYTVVVQRFSDPPDPKVEDFD